MTKGILIGVGSVSLACVGLWATTALAHVSVSTNYNEPLYYAALGISIVYFSLSAARRSAIPLVPGMFMFLGVIAHIPSMALFGAVVAVPFASLS